jgi:hypothetical protein
MSREQGLTTQSSTEAEPVATEDDVAGPLLWTLQFLEAQRIFCDEQYTEFFSTTEIPSFRLCKEQWQTERQQTLSSP